jgi:magnesium-transporting ATPase (P-type)
MLLGSNEGRFEPNDMTCRYEAKGLPIEKALLEFLAQNKMDVYNAIINRNSERPKELMIPFDSSLKHAIFIRKDPEDIDYVDVYMIGAPNVIINSS